MKFVKHPSFPLNKCFFTSSGTLWKMQVREWAFAQVDVEDLRPLLNATSNNPNVVEQGDKGIKTTRTGPKTATVRFFAKGRGFTFVQLFDKDPFIAADDLRIQVEVLQRRAASEKDISLTRLDGNTFVINAPDARSYQMNTTVTFSAQTNQSSSILSIFASVPGGTNHVVLSSHGGVPTIAENKDFSKICVFIAGFNTESLRIDPNNCEDVFKTLKGKVAKDCVVWFGGCTIGRNEKFCKTAARASGCTVVAPYMVLPTKRFPKNHVDMLDGFATPVIFGPDEKLISISDFCATQEQHKFVVPV